MYDTVKFRLITDEAAKVANFLTNVETKIKATGEFSEIGNLDNLRVGVYPNSINVFGSLSKYSNGNNLERLTRQDAKRAIEKLSDSLNLPFHQAQVCRLDLADNFILRRPVREYLSLLGEARYFERSTYKKQGLHYSNSRRAMVFYDKRKECFDKKQPIPEVFQGRNVLRYELRFTKRLSSQFKTTVKAVDLCNEDFYIGDIDKWQKEYFRISKQAKQRLDTQKVKGVKELSDQVVLKGLEAMGGKQVLFEIFENERASGNLDRFKHKRFKDKVNRIVSNPKYFEPNDCIVELDQKVRQAARYYR